MVHHSPFDLGVARWPPRCFSALTVALDRHLALGSHGPREPGKSPGSGRKVVLGRWCHEEPPVGWAFDSGSAGQSSGASAQQQAGHDWRGPLAQGQ